MRPSTGVHRLVLPTLAVLIGGCLVGAPIGHAAPPDDPPGSLPSAPRATVEPEPGVTLTVGLGGLEKGAKGGVATIRVRVSGGSDLSEAVLSATAPAGTVFADGSRNRTWKVKPASDGTQIVPVDVLISEDGTFELAFELEGSLAGRPVRRGAAIELLVGVTKESPRARGGAIEYPAVAKEGSRR